MADKGVIIEYDFAAMDGAGLLFGLTERFLSELDGIPFDSTVEARHFAGGSYQGCFAEYFQAVKSKKTALKAARDFDELVRREFTVAVARPPKAGFVDFVKTLVAKRVKVVVATRADLEQVRGAFAAVPGVELYREESTTYGALKWDAWRLACVRAGLRPYNTIVVAGSGLSVKAALRAGVGAVAVMNDRTAYQDYTGCDEFFQELDGAAAKTVLEILRI